jgi:outer membrane receptor for ferrienterochelin and colicin
MRTAEVDSGRRRARRAGARWIPALLLMALAAPGEALADEVDDARRHFLVGVEHLRSGDYQGALEEFKQANSIVPHPYNIYNIARCYEELGQSREALAYYRRYLEQVPQEAGKLAPVIEALESEAATVVVEIDPAPGPSVGATSEEIERLQAIAAELEALGLALSQRAAEEGGEQAGQTGGQAGGEPPDEVTPPTVDGELPAAELLADAYAREVVTASRYGQSPLDSPSTISILTAQDIRLSGASSLGDLMRRVVGVDVMFLSGSQPDVAIRGFNKEFSNKVLVLIDGRSVYLDHLGSPLWVSFPITLEEIERVEIIRGPGAAIYGANAVTGVINIITKVPGQAGNQVTVEGGTPGYTRVSTLLSGVAEGGTRYRATASYHQTGRWSTTLDEDQTAQVEWDPGQQSAMQISQAHLRLDRSLKGGGFASASAGYSGGFSEFYAIGTLGDFYLDYDAIYLRGDLSKGRARLRTFYNGLAGPVGPWSSAAGSRGEEVLNSELDLDTIDVDLESDGTFTTGAVEHRVIGGVGYRLRAVSWGYLSNPYDGKDPDERIIEHHFNVFAQEEASWERLRGVASLRVDRHPLVDISETLSPRAAMIVRVAEGTSVRASGGTSFRMPSAVESYVNLNQPSSVDGVYVRTLGDTTLLPERVLTGEVGVHDESTAYHQADATVFVNRVQELIVLRDMEPEVAPYDPEAGGFAAGNTGFRNDDASFLGYGVELDGRVFPVDGVDVYANLALTRIQRTSEDADGQPVIEEDLSTSAVRVNAGVMYRSPWRVDLALHAHYRSEQEWRIRSFDEQGQIVETVEPLPARTILVGRVAARPFPGEALELSVSGWNLADLFGDYRFREHPKGQLVGSRLYGSLTYQF